MVQRWAMGERVGNTPLDQLLVNLKLLGWIDNDLSRLGEYCEMLLRGLQLDGPVQLPGLRTRRFPNGHGRTPL